MTYYTYSVMDKCLPRRMYMIAKTSGDERLWLTDKRQLKAHRLFTTPYNAKVALRHLLCAYPGWNYGTYRLEKIFIN